MARFLLTSWHFAGHLYPLVSIAHALRDRGHECAFYTAGKQGPLLTGEGFTHFPYVSVDVEKVDDILFSPQRASSHPSGTFEFTRIMREWMLDTVPGQVTDLESIIASWKPDVIVSDPCFWAPLLVLQEKLGIPVTVGSFFPGAMIPGPDAPPFGLGLPSPKNFWTRLLCGAVGLGQSVVAVGFRRRAAEIRASYGLPALTGPVLSHAASAKLYLVPCSPEFDYNRRDLPACVRYVGPFTWNKPSNLTNPEWLDTLGHERPWVHATEGTVHIGDPIVLRSTAQGLAGLPMEVILTTGGHRQPEEMNLGAIAPNIHIAKWISHGDLLPRTDVMITTGGAGSVMAALKAAVPLILIPTEWDKPEIAQRLVETGAGIRIPPGKCSSVTVRAAVERVLGDPSYRDNALRLSKIFASYGGAGQAARLLEEVVPAKG